MAAELTPGGVDSACRPAEVGEISTSVLLEGYSISGTVALPRNDSYLAAKLPYARTELGMFSSDVCLMVVRVSNGDIIFA